MPRAFRKSSSALSIRLVKPTAANVTIPCAREYLSTSAISAPLQWPSAMVLEYL